MCTLDIAVFGAINAMLYLIFWRYTAYTIIRYARVNWYLQRFCIHHPIVLDNTLEHFKDDMDDMDSLIFSNNVTLSYILSSFQLVNCMYYVVLFSKYFVSFYLANILHCVELSLHN